MPTEQTRVKIGVLKRLAHFRPVEKFGAPRYLSAGLIPDAQHVLGVYENVPDSAENAVIFTDTAIWVERSDAFREVPYVDIAAIRSSPDSKRTADSLVLSLVDGSEMFVKVAGKNAEGADVFSVQRFLIHAAPRR